MKERLSRVDRKIAGYRRIAENPRHIHLLAKMQGIDCSTQELIDNYMGTSETLRILRDYLRKKK